MTSAHRTRSTATAAAATPVVVAHLIAAHHWHIANGTAHAAVAHDPWLVGRLVVAAVGVVHAATATTLVVVVIGVVVARLHLKLALIPFKLTN